MPIPREIPCTHSHQNSNVSPVHIDNKRVTETSRLSPLAAGVLFVTALLKFRGAILKVFRVLAIALLLVFVGSSVRADGGGDGQPKLGGSGPGSPNCNSFQASSNANGAINADCTVNGSTATTIIFAAPDSGTNGGLTCTAQQLTAIGWTQNANVQTNVNGVLIDECSFTAPTASNVSLQDIGNAILESLFAPTGNSSCQCNWDNFIFGIPVGCDITVTTNGDSPNQLFAPNTQFDVAPAASTLVPFPEPGTLWLMFFGLAGLAIVHRRFARKLIA
jgi:hypothetical protein